MYSSYCRLSVFFVIFLLAFIVYYPGIKGGFLFDDFHNLEPLGYFNGVQNWETFKSFVFSGTSGPTGRPLSLTSFLLDDNSWPSYAPYFKYTNVLIHLLCGLLLCWAVLLLLRNLKSVTEQQAQWVAILACAFWLLHPYMVSTTLYVIQRMAQLATLFSLVGIVLYLYGRLQIPAKPVKAYLLMMFGIGTGTILGTFSKENGALLPLLILVIEFCLPSDERKPAWQWRALCLWLPSIAIAVLMARYLDFSENAWPNRNFNQIERLLTEARIVCEYLFHLVLPSIEGKGLYQDGYIISKSLLDPISTLFSTFFLFSLFIGALIIRKKEPIIALAVLFFFAAHAMESTILNLELYFEHRNYQASLFLFLPIAYYAVTYKSKYRIISPILFVTLTLLVAITYLRVSLWSNTDKLELYWVQAAVNSPRAANKVATLYMANGQYVKADEHLQEASKRLPYSSLLTARILHQKVYAQSATQQDFIKAKELLLVQEFDAQTVMSIRIIIEKILEIENIQYAEYSLVLLKAMNVSQIYNQLPMFLGLSSYLQAQLYLLLDQPKIAYQYFSEAMGRYDEIDTALAIVSKTARAGYYPEALALLEQSIVILNHQKTSSLKRSRTLYENDIEQLRRALISAIQSENEEVVPDVY